MDDGKRLQRALLAWYRRERRPLPWRATRDPYAIWVSEAMLQQTQVTTVIPYYERWLLRFPTLAALAAAPEDEVLRHWQGLGYYSRARRLHQAARVVLERHGGHLPASEEQRRALPGVGAYTAGAVASIAFGQAVPVVDGNVVRVLTRLDALRGDPTRAPLSAELWRRARALLPQRAPGDFNQALMELGATVCTPRSPRCAACPLQSRCKALRLGLVERLPELPRRPPVTHTREVSLIVTRGARSLVERVPKAASRSAGLWSFPSAELAPSEAPLDALRALARARGLELGPPTLLQELSYSVTRFRVALEAYTADLVGAPPPRRAHARWCRAEQLTALALPAAQRRLAAALAARRPRGPGAPP